MNSFRYQQFENYQCRSVAERHVPLSADPLGGRTEKECNDSAKVLQLFPFSSGYIHFLLCNME
jgi:hypothetical protein